MYNYLLKNINNFLRFYYYDYYFKDNQITNFKKNIFRFDYFIYLKFYVMYLFLYNLKLKNTIAYSFLLNFQYLVGELCMNNYEHYKIKSKDNINFLNDVSIYFFDLLLLNEFYFNKNISQFNKMIIISNILIFQIGIIINKLFTKRINCIKNKIDLKDNMNFLFLLPGFEDIYKAVEKTKSMNYYNFYIYLNLILFLFY
jgi:hypothetical protein